MTLAASRGFFDTALDQVPLVEHPVSYAVALIVISVAALGSGLLVQRNLDHLDLIGGLKLQE